jgi:hypothetical protein
MHPAKRKHQRGQPSRRSHIAAQRLINSLRSVPRSVSISWDTCRMATRWPRPRRTRGRRRGRLRHGPPTIQLVDGKAELEETLRLQADDGVLTATKCGRASTSPRLPPSTGARISWARPTTCTDGSRPVPTLHTWRATRRTATQRPAQRDDRSWRRPRQRACHRHCAASTGRGVDALLPTRPRCATRLITTGEFQPRFPKWRTNSSEPMMKTSPMMITGLAGDDLPARRRHLLHPHRLAKPTPRRRRQSLASPRLWRDDLGADSGQTTNSQHKPRLAMTSLLDRLCATGRDGRVCRRREPARFRPLVRFSPWSRMTVWLAVRLALHSPVHLPDVAGDADIQYIAQIREVRV